MVLQCNATVLKEQLKLCLAAEGFGNRLCFLEPTSNAQVCAGRRAGRGSAKGRRVWGPKKRGPGVWRADADRGESREGAKRERGPGVQGG